MNASLDASGVHQSFTRTIPLPAERGDFATSASCEDVATRTAGSRRSRRVDKLLEEHRRHRHHHEAQHGQHGRRQPVRLCDAVWDHIAHNHEQHGCSGKRESVRQHRLDGQHRHGAHNARHGLHPPRRLPPKERLPPRHVQSPEHERRGHALGNILQADGDRQRHRRAHAAVGLRRGGERDAHRQRLRDVLHRQRKDEQLGSPDLLWRRRVSLAVAVTRTGAPKAASGSGRRAAGRCA
mmetsp:Transcript_5700/g.20462  ORF Transcript_5700/g.20462 Transcript_5700/m.20462 type:complete len:238 (-) Transcript_5700:773-1486(-)